MPWAVDHGLSHIRMSVSNFSHFQYLNQNISMMAAMTAILKVFNCYLLPNSVGWSGNLVECTGAAWRCRIAKMVLF